MNEKKETGSGWSGLDAAIEKLAEENAKPKARRVVLNPEMAAVADIEEILGKLTPRAAERVLAWVNETVADQKAMEKVHFATTDMR